MGNTRYNHYSLSMLSPQACGLLPAVLDEMGYEGRYMIINDTLSINSTAPTVGRAFHRAETKAKGEEGHMVLIKQRAYSSIWIPESEAATRKEAYRAALRHVENGWPVDQDPETCVGSAEDFGYREEWELEYL